MTLDLVSQLAKLAVLDTAAHMAVSALILLVAACWLRRCLAELHDRQADDPEDWCLHSFGLIMACALSIGLMVGSAIYFYIDCVALAGWLIAPDTRALNLT